MAKVTVVPLADQVTISVLIDDFLMSCRARGLTKSTVENGYSYALRRLFLPWCKARGVGCVPELSRRDIDDFSVYLREQAGTKGKLSTNTIHTYSRAIRGFLPWCEREGEGEAPKPSLPRLPRKVIDVLTREEIDRMEDVAASERDKLAVRILGDCGVRASELCRLTPDDLVRRDSQTYLHINGKGARERLVPIMPRLFRRLERYSSRGRPRGCESSRIFVGLRRGLSGEYEPLQVSGLRQMISGLAYRAGIDKRTYTHLLRHSFITNALRDGMSPLLVAQIAGHSSLKMLEMHYSHLNMQDAYKAMTHLMLKDRVD